ncbi:MAG: HNH endonuclease [Dehalococcoidia bacterium]|jgi:hypothetical protein
MAIIGYNLGMEKELRSIVGFPGYSISNYGEIYSFWTGGGGVRRLGTNMRRLSTRVDEAGREAITLSRNRTRVSRKVCRLVLEAFVGECPRGMEACHFPDRSPLNNRLDNLRWDTKSSNQHDRIGHGTTNDGERNGSAKLSATDIKPIRDAHDGGETYKSLARKYNVSLSAIQQVCERTTWKTIKD